MLNWLKKISAVGSKFTIVIIVFCGVLAYFVPPIFSWVKGTAQNLLLGFIIFAMGLSIKGAEIRDTFKKPWLIFMGVVLQYTLMPLIAFLLTSIFNFDLGIKIGLVLVACVPGAAASNVMSYLAKGDVALSITVTMFTTMLSPVLTPLLIYAFLHTSVSIDLPSMIKSVVLIVLIPMTLGILIRKLVRENILVYCTSITPLLAIIGLGFIVGGAVAQLGAGFFDGGWVLIGSATALNVLGYIGGWGVSLAFRVPPTIRRTFTIEIGMQNAGLATTIASLYFSSFSVSIALAAFACAWFAVTGAILAKILSCVQPEESENKLIQRR